MWDPQMVELEKDFRILRCDKRGHGQSSVPPGPYDLDDLIMDIVSIWDALEIEKSHLVGISVGSATALGVVLNHPQRVDRLAICDAVAPARPNTKPAGLNASRSPGKKAWNPWWAII